MLSQNLIPNGDLENYSECPDNFDQLYVLDDWFLVQTTNNNTPDYFNACADESTMSSVPENVAGFQPAHSGSGYLSNFMWGNDSGQREYVYTELSEQLIGGRVYELSFYVSLCDQPEIGINNIGALFTQKVLVGSTEINLIEADPQVKAIKVITDKDGWFEIKGEFIAEGGEKYMAVGNFFSDEDTETQSVWPFNWPNWSKYYLDSFSLIEKPLSIPGHQNDSSLTISPNPASETLVVANSGSDIIKTVTIFDMLGREVMVKAIGEPETSLNLSELRNGNYFLSIEFDNGEVYFERIIKH